VKRVVVVLLVLLALLHQDFWYWNHIEPLVFGFIPIGLAYHMGVSIAAAILWAMAVHYCWPRDVDVSEGPFTSEPTSLQAKRGRP
jgi:hypothetical protein